MEDRDRRRWDLADENKDERLSKEEFSHFLHPEEADHMRDIVVQETLEDIDKARLSILERLAIFLFPGCGSFVPVFAHHLCLALHSRKLVYLATEI